MFSDTKYEIEYVQIVPLRDNVTIGISYEYIHYNKTIKVTGIHLKKMNTLNQHELIVSDHNCDCLNSFISTIDDLHIGNPGDDKNRYKAAKKEVTDLKTKIDIVKIENQQLKNENEELKQEHSVALNELKNENDILRNYIAQLQNNHSNGNSSHFPAMVPYDTSSSYIKCNLSNQMTKSNTANASKYTNINANSNSDGFVMLNNYSNNQYNYGY